MDLLAGGSVTNGGAGLSRALLSGGGNGVLVVGTGSVVNSGTITGGTGVGVYLKTGGAISNGVGGIVGAKISGGLQGAVLKAANARVTNEGSITGGTTGIVLTAGGTILNGTTSTALSTISGGAYGITVAGPAGGTVVNNGTIKATGSAGIAISISGGIGIVTNGSAPGATSASITGVARGVFVSGARGTVGNVGTILATGGGSVGVYLMTGGSVTNGDAGVGSALISGHEKGVSIRNQVGTVTNYGRIEATVNGSVGVTLTSGGVVVNGAAGTTSASISGRKDGVGIIPGGSVANYGTIAGATREGIYFFTGGSLTNGGSGAIAAAVSGGVDAVRVTGARGTVINSGTLSGETTGVNFLSGGLVVNGASGAAAALISTAGTGIKVIRAATTIVNDGTIQAGGTGIYARVTATITNGASAASALISGVKAAIDLGGAAGAVANFGSIAATGATGVGVLMSTGGTVTNGSTTATGATISGVSAGVRIASPASGTRTVVNFGTITGGVGVDLSSNNAVGRVDNAGTIIGTGGQAVSFGNGNDTLVLRAGASFGGQVSGSVGTDTIELAAGAAGALGGVGTALGGFERMVVDTGADWTMSGANTIANVSNAGTVRVGDGASLVVTGTMDPTGAGSVQLQANSVLEVAASTGARGTIQFIGPSTLSIDSAAAFGTGMGTTGYSGPLLLSFGAGDAIDMKNVLLAGATLDYAATSGLLQVTAGGSALATLAFDAATLGSGAFAMSNDGTGHLLLTRA